MAFPLAAEAKRYQSWLSLASRMYRDPIDELVPAGDVDANARAEQEIGDEVREAFQEL
jgi:5-methylcytosine-specific restriction protein B